MYRLNVEKFPSIASLYSAWLVLLYIIVAYAIATGDMLYRMEQVIDYLGNISSSRSRENTATILMAMALFTELVPLWFGAILIRLEAPHRRWMRWPITAFCLGIAYTVVHNTSKLHSLYYNLIGPHDWVFAGATVAFMLLMIVVLHGKDNSDREDPTALRDPEVKDSNAAKN